MTPEQLAEIEQRVNATPRGPWIIQYHGELGRMQWIRSDRDEVIVAETADHDDRRPIPEFIAHAREDVPALVAEVKRLTTERDADRAEIVELCQERLQLTAERDSLKGLLSGGQQELRDATTAQGKAERERDEALAVIEVRDHEHEQLEARHRAFLGAGARLEAQLREARAALDRVRALADEWSDAIAENRLGEEWIACLRANLPALRDALDGSGS